MQKILYVHIGTGKTGTTALQDFFLLNSVMLKKLGVEYAKCGMVKNNHHMLCRNYLRSNEEAQARISSNLKQLNYEMSESCSASFLISSEYFPGLSPEEILELKNEIEAEIIPIVYLRRQDEFLESWYAQIVKAHQNRESIYLLKERLKKDGIFDYVTLTEEWSKINNNKKIIVRAYEKEGFAGGNIFFDFINAIGLELTEESFIFPDKDPNPSIKPNQIKLALELYDYCNVDQRKLLFSPIEDFHDRSLFFLSTSERQELINEFSSINEKVATKYLARKSLFINNLAKETDVGDNIITDSFIDHFVYFLFFNNKEMLNKIEDPVIKFLKIESQKYRLQNMHDVELRLLQLAFIIRPNGKHINELLNNCVVKKFGF